MTDFLRCQICGELVENAMCFLHDHIKGHIGNYKEEAERENEDIDVWVLSYFDSVEKQGRWIDICTECGKKYDGPNHPLYPSLSYCPECAKRIQYAE